MKKKDQQKDVYKPNQGMRNNTANGLTTSLRYKTYYGDINLVGICYPKEKSNCNCFKILNRSVQYSLDQHCHGQNPITNGTCRVKISMIKYHRLLSHYKCTSYIQINLCDKNNLYLSNLMRVSSNIFINSFSNNYCFFRKGRDDDWNLIDPFSTLNSISRINVRPLHYSSPWKFPSINSNLNLLDFRPKEKNYMRSTLLIGNFFPKSMISICIKTNLGIPDEQMKVIYPNNYEIFTVSNKKKLILKIDLILKVYIDININKGDELDLNKKYIDLNHRNYEPHESVVNPKAYKIMNFNHYKTHIKNNTTNKFHYLNYKKGKFESNDKYDIQNNCCISYNQYEHVISKKYNIDKKVWNKSTNYKKNRIKLEKAKERRKKINLGKVKKQITTLWILERLWKISFPYSSQIVPITNQWLSLHGWDNGKGNLFSYFSKPFVSLLLPELFLSKPFHLPTSFIYKSNTCQSLSISIISSHSDNQHLSKPNTMQTICSCCLLTHEELCVHHMYNKNFTHPTVNPLYIRENITSPTQTYTLFIMEPHPRYKDTLIHLNQNESLPIHLQNPQNLISITPAQPDAHMQHIYGVNDEVMAQENIIPHAEFPNVGGIITRECDLPLDDEEEDASLKFAMVAKFAQGPVELSLVLAKFKKEWELLKGDYWIEDVGNNWLMMKFSNAEDFANVWKWRPYHVQGRLMVIYGWNNTFDPFESIVATVDTWVRIPLLPIRYHKSKVLQTLFEEQKIGELLKLETNNASSSNTRYIRACLKVIIPNGLKCKLYIDCNGVVNVYTVWYEDFSPGCGKCGDANHTFEACPLVMAQPSPFPIILLDPHVPPQSMSQPRISRQSLADDEHAALVARNRIANAEKAKRRGKNKGLEIIDPSIPQHFEAGSTSGGNPTPVHVAEHNNPNYAKLANLNPNLANLLAPEIYQQYIAIHQNKKVSSKYKNVAVHSAPTRTISPKNKNALKIVEGAASMAGSQGSSAIPNKAIKTKKGSSLIRKETTEQWNALKMKGKAVPEMESSENSFINKMVNVGIDSNSEYMSVDPDASKRKSKDDKEEPSSDESKAEKKSKI